MISFNVDFPEGLINLYYGKVYNEIPRLTSCKEIETRVSELIVQDLEDYNGVSD